MFGRSVSPAVTRANGTLLAQSQSDIKVNQTNIILRRHHNICRFDVAVQDAIGRTAVKITKRLQKLAGPVNDLRLRKTLSPLQRFVQTLSLNVIHHGVDSAAFRDKIVHLRDISMTEDFQGVHFPAQHFRLCGQSPFVRF